jgi:hypothetical protein
MKSIYLPFGTAWANVIAHGKGWDLFFCPMRNWILFPSTVVMSALASAPSPSKTVT